MWSLDHFVDFFFSRPLSRPAYQEPSSYHHNYEYHDNVIHQRQRSNEYIPQRQQAIEHFHQRQNSDLSEQHTQEFYSQRLTPTRPYTPREHWQNTESAPALMRQYPHPQPPPGPAPQYGDPIFAYRDPIYTSMAGKRSVQSLSQTGSAKVWHRWICPFFDHSFISVFDIDQWWSHCSTQCQSFVWWSFVMSDTVSGNSEFSLDHQKSFEHRRAQERDACMVLSWKLSK